MVIVMVRFDSLFKTGFSVEEICLKKHRPMVPTTDNAVLLAFINKYESVFNLQKTTVQHWFLLRQELVKVTKLAPFSGCLYQPR